MAFPASTGRTVLLAQRAIQDCQGLSGARDHAVHRAPRALRARLGRQGPSGPLAQLVTLAVAWTVKMQPICSHADAAVPTQLPRTPMRRKTATVLVSWQLALLVARFLWAAGP